MDDICHYFSTPVFVCGLSLYTKHQEVQLKTWIKFLKLVYIGQLLTSSHNCFLINHLLSCLLLVIVCHFMLVVMSVHCLLSDVVLVVLSIHCLLSHVVLVVMSVHRFYLMLCPKNVHSLMPVTSAVSELTSFQVLPIFSTFFYKTISLDSTQFLNKTN